MGRRKTRKKPVTTKKKVKRPLEQTFECPFCNVKECVTVQFVPEEKKALLSCSSCGVKYESKYKKIDQAIDIFYEWIDKASELQKEIQREQATERERDISKTIKRIVQEDTEIEPRLQPAIEEVYTIQEPQSSDEEET